MGVTQDDLLTAFELHSVEGIRAALDSGTDPRAPFRGKPPIAWLTEMYSRSDRFPDCLRLLLDRGAILDDPRILPVLLDDAEALHAASIAVNSTSTTTSGCCWRRQAAPFRRWAIFRTGT